MSSLLSIFQRCTQITWGDLLFMGDDAGADTVAMFVLMAHEHEGSFQYRAGLWGVRGDRYGKPVDWDSAQASGQLAAYDAEHKVWEGSMARQDAEAWAGRIPSASGANNLGLAPGMYDYQFATYVDAGFWWWTAAAVTTAAAGAELGLVALPIAATRIVGGAALAVDAAGMFNDAFNVPRLPSGPVEATYPVVYYDPLRIGRATQIHFNPPGGIAP